MAARTPSAASPHPST